MRLKYLANNSIGEWQIGNWSRDGLSLEETVEKVDLSDLDNPTTKHNGEIKNRDQDILLTYIGSNSSKISVGYGENIIAFPNTTKLKQGTTVKLIIENPTFNLFIIRDGWTGNINGVVNKEKEYPTEIIETATHTYYIFGDVILRLNIGNGVESESKLRMDKMYYHFILKTLNDYLMFPDLEGVYQLYKDEEFAINVEFWKHTLFRNHVIDKFRNGVFMKKICFIFKGEHIVINLIDLSLGQYNKHNVLKEEYTPLENINITDIRNDSLRLKIQDNEAKYRDITVGNIVFRCVIFPNKWDELSNVLFDYTFLKLRGESGYSGCFKNNGVLKLVKGLIEF